MHKIIKICLFSFLALTNSALAKKSFKHPTCKVFFQPFEKIYSWDDKLLNRVKSNLKQRGYIIAGSLSPKKTIEPGDFHVLIKRTLSGKIFKGCLMEVYLKQAKTQYALDNDPVIYESQKVRKFPRQTFKGRERCYLAADDLFFSIDICKIR